MDFEDYENLICPCGKAYEDWETCPICDEPICIDCEDYERYHAEEAGEP